MCWLCSLASAPRAGCRLSQGAGPVALLFLSPWPPSLPASLRFGSAFADLPVLRSHPTSLDPSSSRLSSLMSTVSAFTHGDREISPGKNAKLHPKPSPIRTPPDGYWASLQAASSTPRSCASSALHLCSVPSCTSGFHQTQPRGCALALLVAGSLRQGPERTSISLCHASRHLLSRAHAGRTAWR